MIMQNVDLEYNFYALPRIGIVLQYVKSCCRKMNSIPRIKLVNFKNCNSMQQQNFKFDVNLLLNWDTEVLISKTRRMQLHITLLKQDKLVWEHVTQSE